MERCRSGSTSLPATNLSNCSSAKLTTGWWPATPAFQNASARSSLVSGSSPAGNANPSRSASGAKTDFWRAVSERLVAAGCSHQTLESSVRASATDVQTTLVSSFLKCEMSDSRPAVDE